MAACSYSASNARCLLITLHRKWQNRSIDISKITRQESYDHTLRRILASGIFPLTMENRIWSIDYMSEF